MNKKLKLDELQRKSIEEFQSTDKSNITIVLDNVRSAHNVGSFFRTADGFLINEIILVGITPKPPHKEIRKTALGATETVAWKHFENQGECIDYLKDNKTQIISIEQVEDKTFLQNYHPTKNDAIALVFGNEVEGVHQDFIDASDKIVEIPQFGTKHSFNVAVSGGMIIWDVYQKMYL